MGRHLNYIASSTMSLSWRFVAVPDADRLDRFHELITDNAMPFLEAGCNIEIDENGVLTIDDGLFTFPTTTRAVQDQMSGMIDEPTEAVKVILSLVSYTFGYKVFETNYEGDPEIDSICNDIYEM
jgi:hypothetical protein